MAPTTTFDVIVLGGGSGGSAFARRAAGYGHALSVFAAEASLPGRDDARLGRAHLAESLGLCQDAASRELPLLFGLVATLQDQQAAARER